MRVVGYVRVSTDEQADSGAGLEAQRAAIQARCGASEWDLVEVCEDAGLSGRSLGRPGLERALDLVKGDAADGIVVAKVDRLSRSLLDFTSLVERSRSEGWQLVALDIGIDTSTSQGDLLANIIASFAQVERKVIGERTKDALAIKKSEGVRLGRPPVLSDELVGRIEQMRNAGQSYRAIADALNRTDVPTAHGGKQWYPATIRKLLLRRGAEQA